jgi:lipoprotein-releasing system permease protein
LRFLFAWRYFKAKKSTNAINVIAWTSISAIIIGTAALILVLGVFNGFEGLVKSLYSSFYTDWRVSPEKGKIIQISKEQLEKLRLVNGVSGFSPIVEERALLQAGDNQSIVYLKGVDSAFKKITSIDKHIIDGQYDIGTTESPKLILGAGVEEALGIYAGKEVLPLTVYLPKANAQKQLDLTSDIVVDQLNAAGSFLIQQDFDNKYALTDAGFLQTQLGLQTNQFSSVEIGVASSANPKEIREELKKIFPQNALIQDRYEQNKSLFAVMSTERWIVYGVLSLILLVAAFNMVGALTMLVLEKQKDIAVLHALGSNTSFIQQLFLSEGLLLAIIGAGIGMILASILAWLQINFHLIPLQGGSFLIDYYPVKLKIADFLLIGTTVLVIAILASWIPAAKAAKRSFSLRTE